jgi:hypothetical protein
MDEFQWSEVAEAGGGFGNTQVEAAISNGSVCEKKTAERPTSTRSSTLQGLLASEVAWWPNTRAKSASETLLSLGNSLANHVNTVGIKESTPNGAYGVFAEDWRGARWPVYDDYWKIWGVAEEAGPGNGYIRVFAAWYEFAEYEREPEGGNVEVSVDEAEDEGRDVEFIRRMLARRGVTDEKEVGRITARKIAWRRWCVRDADRGRGDLEKFKQEYPSDPVSCFLHSGKPRFNNEGVARIEVMARGNQGAMYGVLDKQADGSVMFRKTGRTEAVVIVWEMPKVGCHYGIPIDPMTGADQTVGAVDPDHNSVGVMRRGYRDENGVQWNDMLVARMMPGNTMDAGPGVEIVARLAALYGGCIVIPEVNKGLHWLERCKDQNLNIYRRTVGTDRLRDELMERLGWETNEQTRLQIIESLADAIRGRTLDVYCETAASQLRTFVRNKSGKPEAAPGCKDDDVLMLAIGEKCRDSFTKFVDRRMRRSRIGRDDYG